VYLNRFEYEQHVICSPSSELKEYSKKMGFEYRETKIVRAIRPCKDLLSLWIVFRYIKKNKINIVVGHAPKGALLSMLAAFILRVPKRIYFRHGLVFETMNGSMRSLMILIDKITAFCATQVVCVSPSLLVKSLEYKLNPPNKQMIIGKGTCGGVDAQSKFNPKNIVSHKLTKLRKSLNIDDDCFVIGYCGRLVRDKGIIDLVEAFEYVLKKVNIRVKLLLVGDFEHRDSIPIHIQSSIKDNKNIVITGFIFDQIEYYYALMNLFILPSYREGFGMSVLEASSMEIPVLTTKATGCRDSIIEGVTGYYVDNTPNSISSMIINLINSDELKILGQNGRRFVLENFDHRILWPIIKDELYS